MVKVNDRDKIEVWVYGFKVCLFFWFKVVFLFERKSIIFGNYVGLMKFLFLYGKVVNRLEMNVELVSRVDVLFIEDLRYMLIR